jgi:hypothetical protein
MRDAEPVAVRGPARPLAGQLRADAGRLARTMRVAVPLGAVSVGVVSRLAMFVLAQTNASAAGMTSDDGFTIHQFTLSGSLNLVVVGVFLGALSGVCWLALAPLKFGPAWFQRLSLSVGAGVVVASQVVHSDGVDFVFLDEPFLLAVALFVLIPVAHVFVLDLLVSRVHGRQAFTGRRWTVAGTVLALPMAPLVALLALARAFQLAVLRPGGAWSRGLGWAVRGALAALFATAVASITGDVAALT